MIPSYQQIPPVPAFDGSSLHARGISHSQPSFNTSAKIVYTDLDDVPVLSPLSSLEGQPPQQAQPASTTSPECF